ncbi:MAG: ATPase [Gemmiger sp.]
MNVDELLDLMEETLEEGTAVPFAPSKRMVDVDRMRDIIDEVRNNLPDELRESKKIVNDREQIIANARSESEQIIKQAEDRARGLVSEQEIVKRAQQRAAEILTASQSQAKELTRNATLYCEGVLKNSEEVLARSVAEVKNTRLNLRNVASRGMHSKKQGQ